MPSLIALNDAISSAWALGGGTIDIGRCLSSEWTSTAAGWTSSQSYVLLRDHVTLRGHSPQASKLPNVRMATTARSESPGLVDLMVEGNDGYIAIDWRKVSWGRVQNVYAGLKSQHAVYLADDSYYCDFDHCSLTGSRSAVQIYAGAGGANEHHFFGGRLICRSSSGTMMELISANGILLDGVSRESTCAWGNQHGTLRSGSCLNIKHSGSRLEMLGYGPTMDEFTPGVSS